MNRTLDYYNHSPTHNQRFTSLKKLLSVLLGKVYATRSVREKMRHPVLKNTGGPFSSHESGGKDLESSDDLLGFLMFH